MTKGMLIVVGSLLVLAGVAFAAEQSGLIGSGDGPGLLAAEVSLAPGSVALAQEAPPPAVLGPVVDCPPSGAGPEDSQQRYDDLGAAFRVIGTLSSFDAATAVVAGPTGEISATLAQQFDLRGDLSPGSTVDLRGTIADGGARTAHEVHSACAAAGMIDCAGGEDPHFQLHVDGDTFEVTGRLESLTTDQVQILGPGLTVEIKRDPGTQIESGLKTGDPVTVAGQVLNDRQLLALTVALRCQEAIGATPTTAAPATSGQSLASVDDSAGEDDDQGEDEDCKHGARGRGAARLKVKKDGEARIKHGAVLSSDSGSLTVDTPAGPVLVRIVDDTEVSGDLAAAAEVEIEGVLDDDDSVLATEVEVLCRSAGEEQDEGDDQTGNGRGNGRGGNGQGESDEDKDDKEQGRGKEDDDGGEDD